MTTADLASMNIPHHLGSGIAPPSPLLIFSLTLTMYILAANRRAAYSGASNIGRHCRVENTCCSGNGVEALIVIVPVENYTLFGINNRLELEFKFKMYLWFICYVS